MNIQVSSKVKNSKQISKLIEINDFVRPVRRLMRRLTNPPLLVGRLSNSSIIDPIIASALLDRRSSFWAKMEMKMIHLCSIPLCFSSSPGPLHLMHLTLCTSEETSKMKRSRKLASCASSDRWLAETASSLQTSFSISVLLKKHWQVTTIYIHIERQTVA